MKKASVILEADALEMCRESSNVINIVERFKLKGRSYFVTKYAAGGDLTNFCMKYQKLAEGARLEGWLTEQQVRHIFKQIATGVSEIHQQGLVHRDLKLLNIFLYDLNKMPRVKIGDLGSAVHLGPGE